MQSNPIRIAIIDDDPFVMAHLEKSFERRFPDVDVVGVSDPVAPVGFDVYIIDRDFGGNQCGQDLIKRVKKISPESLVIAYSAFLDRKFLRNLILEHCEGAFDKGSLSELEKMMDLIESYVDSQSSSGQPTGSLSGTVRSIFDLIREWNIRLANNGHASVRYHQDV